MIGANQAEIMLDRDTLEKNRQKALIDIVHNNLSGEKEFEQ